MDKIIYSKYSYNRDPKFQCRTMIKSTDFGDMYVLKNALNTCETKHISNIFRNYQQLLSKYQNTSILVAKCNLVNESTVQFDYIHGKNLENLLDIYVERNEYKKVVELITAYFDELMVVDELCFFENTAEFNNIFGTYSFPAKTMSIRNGNLDAIFSNVKLFEDKYYFIDYEWCFNFPVPKKYILYRCLFWYINSQCRYNKLKDVNLYKLFDISEKEIEVFSMMEENFQRYVMGKQIPEWNLIKKLSINSFDLDNYTSLIENHRTKIQIYEDHGKGYSEDTSYFISSTSEEANFFSTYLPFQNDLKEVRIDPNIEPCIFIINQLSYRNEKINEIVFEHNGYKFNENIIMFLEDDPKMIFKVGNHIGIDIEGYIIPLSKSSTLYFVKYIKTKTKEITEYKRTMDNQQKYINSLEKAKELHEKKFYRITKSKLFRLISWHFEKEELDL